MAGNRRASRASLLGGLAAGVAVATVGLGAESFALLAIGLAVVAVCAGGLTLHLIASERRRHERVRESLAGQAAFLESLVESMRAIAATSDADETLEVTRRQAERLFGARGTVVRDGEPAGDDRTVVVPLEVRGRRVGSLRLEREQRFERHDVARAALLGDFAARAVENAQLLGEARVREAERAALSERLITAEQDERRRLALFLHDTSVQSLSGIALMLDATMHSIESGKLDDAAAVLTRALERHRATIGALRDLSFALEPVVLRDQGFGPAVHALAQEIGLAHEVQVEVDVGAAESLGEKTQAALYQIVREALEGAVRRGPPERIEVRVARLPDGSVETVVHDDAPGERRRSTIETLEERARTLSGRLEVDHGAEGGTTVRVTVPAYGTG